MEFNPIAGTHPASGTTTFPYPLEAALTDVEATPPINHSRWRDAHHDARLVAAWGRHDAPTSRWNLLWGTPEGLAYELEARRAAGRPPEIVDLGPRGAPRFLPADVPTAFLAFGDAELVWKRMAPEGLTVNRLAWGYDAWAERAEPSPCDETSGLDLAFPVEGWMAVGDGFRRMAAGSERLAPCTSDAPKERTLSFTTLDATSGRIVAHRESRAEFDSPGPASTAPSEPEVFAARHVLRPPSVEGTAIAAAPILLVFLGAYLSPLLKFAGAQALLVVPAYSKLERSKLLDQRVRDLLMRLIEQEPGLSATELQERAEVGWGTAVYHLTTLERAQMVSSLVDGRHRRFFPVGRIDWSERGQVAVLRNARTKALLEAIEAEPGVIQQKLIAVADVSRPSAIWHLRRLEDVGLVGRVRAGRKVHYYRNDLAPSRQPYDPRTAVDVA